MRATPMDIEGRSWYEIDNYEDLAKAEVIFNQFLPLITRKKLFVLDKDGTISLGHTPIDGVLDVLRKLNNKEIKWTVGSNNSSRTSISHSKSLRSIFGNDFTGDVVSSLDVATHQLSNRGIKNLFWVANSEVSSFLSSKFEYDEVAPKACLLTYDNEITYEKLVKIKKFVDCGIPFYATHIDVVCPTENGDIPDIGGYIAMIERCCGKAPLETFGKPATSFIDYLKEKYDVEENDIVVVGDRIYTDIEMCENSHVTSVLVLSGETSRTDYELSSVKADIVLNSLAEIQPYI